MADGDRLAELFEAHRAHLRTVAYRMLGSLSDADDAVQESWLRLTRSDTTAVENLGGWLTTAVGRICLDMLRSRRSRGEQPLGPHVPDPIVRSDTDTDPEHRAVVSDSIGLALLIVLDRLTPVQRLAFVLHDMFAVPFEEIAALLDRSPTAVRQLTSRARRRVREATGLPDADPTRQRHAVDAFLAAARGGDLNALLEVLDADVVLRADAGAGRGSREVRGARAVVEEALAFSDRARFARPAVVNGVQGLLVASGTRWYSVMAFRVRGARIVEIDILADPARLSRLRPRES